MALERDGALYDVELLERALGEAVPVPGDAWDFHTRVVALGCAGLAELDRKLLQGQRPTEARIGPTGFAVLAPFDTERAHYVHFDPRAAAIHVGHAPSIAGQDALVDPVAGDEPPSFAVCVGVLVGDDLRNATRPEARAAIVGCSVLVDWHPAGRGGHVATTGLRAQLGPVLVPAAALGARGEAAVTAQVGDRQLTMGRLADLGVALDDAVARVSREVPLRAGDLVGVGPLPAGRPEAHGVALAPHDRVAVTIEKIGTLRGAAVPRKA